MSVRRPIVSITAALVAAVLVSPLVPDAAAAEKPDPSGDVVTLVDGQTAFACDLYRRAATTPGDVVFSPWSLDHALSMTWAGARGVTADELASAMHISLPADRHHAAHEAQLDRWLDAGDRHAVVLDVANAFWAHPDTAFVQPYIDILRGQYHAAASTLDFSNPEAARKVVNRWVSEQTRGLVEDLVPPRVLTPLTRLVLANAVHFRARWQDTFPSHATRERTFHTASGADVTLPFMHRTGRVRHLAGDGFQWIALPYVGPAVMEIVLPDAGVDLATIEARLSAAAIADQAASATERSVAVALPRFTAETVLPAKDLLQELGVRAAFGGDADLSGMDGTRLLFVQAVMHKAVVQVDEDGTTAAAASAVAIGKRGHPRVDATFTADRPFLWRIRDTTDGAILFMGRVSEPATAR